MFARAERRSRVALANFYPPLRERFCPFHVVELERLGDFPAQRLGFGRYKNLQRAASVSVVLLSAHSANGKVGSNALIITRWSGSLCFSTEGALQSPAKSDAGGVSGRAA